MDAQVSTLMSDQDLWSTINDYATAAVCLGVLTEILHFKGLEQWLDGKRLDENRRQLIINCGVVVLVIGIAVEWWSGVRLHALDQELYNVSNRALASALQKETDLATFTVQLENAAAPRSTQLNQGGMQQAMRPFKNVPTVFISSHKEEPEEFANAIWTGFEEDTRMHRTLSNTEDPLLMRGVYIEYAVVGPNSTTVLSEGNDTAHEAARALCQELVSQNIFSRTRPVRVDLPGVPTDWGTKIPYDAILVEVGDKPNTLYMLDTIKRITGGPPLADFVNEVAPRPSGVDGAHICD